MTITTPTNTIELLENLITIAKDRLFLDEGFYTKENIKKLTGGERCKLFLKETEQIADSVDFRTITDHHEDGSDGWSIRFALETKPDGKKKARLWANAIVGQPELDYPTIERLVDLPWQETIPTWNSNRIYLPPTNEYGNAEREYSKVTDNLKETVHVAFDAAGTFTSLAFFLEEQ